MKTEREYAYKVYMPDPKQTAYEGLKRLIAQKYKDLELECFEAALAEYGYVKERTCKVISSEMFDSRGIWAIELSCGHADVCCVSMPNHCSYCGAKVVE